MKVKSKRTIKNIIPTILAGLICFAIAIGILLFPNNQKQLPSINLSEFSSVNNICKLATLKSFYHNVAIYEAVPDGSNKFVNDVLLWPFGGYAKIGYKQFWLEYSGIVETGIKDATKIKIIGPDEKGVVEVFIPDAEVIDIFADETSLTEPLSENGWFTTITGKEKMDAFATAQNIMRQEADQDQTLLTKAKDNAKLLLEKYIINTGKEMGIDLTVKWIENPL